MQSELRTFSRREFLKLTAAGLVAAASCRDHRSKRGDRIIYTPRQSKNSLLVSIGDSIARGGSGPDPVSPADLIAESVNNSREGRNWRVLNLAQVGVTTSEVIKHQLLDPKLAEIMGRGETLDADFIIHTGANDIGKSFAGDEKKVARLKERLVNFNIGEIQSAFGELGEAIDGFRKDFLRCLDLMNVLFGRKIRHLIVISPPDFSLAPKINSYASGRTHSFSLDSPLVQLMVKEGCNELKTAIDKTLQNFTAFPVAVIPTSKIGREHFSEDQHLNHAGKVILAKEVLNKMVFPQSIDFSQPNQ